MEEAARTIGAEPARIAKAITLRKDNGCIMLVMAGNAGIGNKKFRHQFGMKARRLNVGEMRPMTGQTVGGISPFALRESIAVYIDISVRSFATLFPACGSSHYVIELTPDEIYEYGSALEWVDVCKTLGGQE